MKHSFLNTEQFPLVIESETTFSFEELLKWVVEHREELHSQLLKHSGLLLRGFPILGADSFHRVIEALGLGAALNYIGGDSPRDKVKGKVYTSTEAPSNLKILLHNEMSFIKNYPRHIYFHCEIPSAMGGATIIGDARTIYQRIDSEVRKIFEEKGLIYISNYYKRSLVLDAINRVQRSHKNWMQVFETESKAEVEKRCQESAFEYTWNAGDWLQVRQRCQATMKHPVTGEMTWFNQAHLYDFNPRHIGLWNFIGTKLVYCKKDTLMHEIRFGDGAKIPKEMLYHVMDVLDACTISYPWQRGDMVVLDNVLAMHGRAPFTGKRRILTALTS